MRGLQEVVALFGPPQQLRRLESISNLTDRTSPPLVSPWGLVQSGRSASVPHKRSSAGVGASESTHGEATDFAFVALKFLALICLEFFGAGL